MSLIEPPNQNIPIFCYLFFKGIQVNDYME